MSLRRLLTIVGLLAALHACGGGGDAPTTPTPVVATPPTLIVQPTNPNGLHLTASPMEVSAIISITPLGRMAPGHTLPTDHIYFYHHEFGNYPPVPVYAPAGGTIEFITNGRVDVIYDAIFRYWIGPLTLADGIRPGARVEAGQLLGHHSQQPAFDFAVLRSTLMLNFVNRARYGRDTLTSDSPMQYFDEPVRSALFSKVQRLGGTVDGKLDYDVAGTLSGNWFAEDLPVADSGRGGEAFYETRKLSFGRDVFAPDRLQVSIGGHGMADMRGSWAVQAGAPDFTQIPPASGLVVYRLLGAGVPLAPPTVSQSGWLLMQLLADSRLRIEAVALPFVASIPFVGPAPTAFTAGASIYVR